MDAELLRALALPVVVLNGCVLHPAAALFDPARDRRERFAEMWANRRTNVQPSQV